MKYLYKYLGLNLSRERRDTYACDVVEVQLKRKLNVHGREFIVLVIIVVIVAIAALAVGFRVVLSVSLDFYVLGVRLVLLRRRSKTLQRVLRFDRIL